MFPGVDGFHWTAGHIFFVSAFLSIAAAIAVVAILSITRTRRDIAAGRAGSLRWSADFSELSPSDRQCRHALTGEAPGRVCPNAFDCRNCSNHSHFRQSERGQAQDTIFGLPYPNYRYYHRGHTWVAPQPDGTLLVGLDAIGERMIGAPDAVQMPSAGVDVSTNGEGWRMWKDGLEVRVLCPVDGTIVQSGGPDDAWHLRILPTTKPADLRHLLRGEEVHAWVGRELERLQIAMAPHGEWPALADGGVLVNDFLQELPEAMRDHVLGEIFLEP
jgi:hypothetical protein